MSCSRIITYTRKINRKGYFANMIQPFQPDKYNFCIHILSNKKNESLKQHNKGHPKSGTLYKVNI